MLHLQSGPPMKLGMIIRLNSSQKDIKGPLLKSYDKYFLYFVKSK